MTSALRSIAPLLLGAALIVSGPSTSAVAQEPTEETQGESGGGSPFHGYFATCALAGFAMFLVARTARR